MDKTNLRFDWAGENDITNHWEDLTNGQLRNYIQYLEGKLVKICNTPDVIGSLTFDEVSIFVSWIGCCNFRYNVKKHIWTNNEKLKLTSEELIERFIKNYR